MHIKPESIAFVAVGRWDKFIFPHDWIAKNIFEVDTINVDFSLEPNAPFSYRKELIRFIPNNQKFEFQVFEYDIDAIKKTGKMFLKAIEFLDKLPFVAIGANITLIEEKPPAKLLKLFNFNDNLSEKFEKIKETTIKRKIPINKELTINISITLDENANIHFHINHNTNAKTGSELLDLLSSNKSYFINQIDNSVDLIKSTYGISLDNGEE